MMKAFWEAQKKILAIAGVAILVLVMMNINSRVSEYFRLDRERNKLATEVRQLTGTQAALVTQVAYATSDAAVEDWARNDAHMAKPGDVVVIQITPQGQKALPEVVTKPTARPVENWEVWWALFFGE